MAFLKHKGRTICYRLLGDNDKPLLILAHALGMTQGAWDEVIPGLLSKFRILTWDLPGHGGSAAWPEASEQISAEDLAAEALPMCCRKVLTACLQQSYRAGLVRQAASSNLPW